MLATPCSAYSIIIKEADGILIGASNGLSIAEGYNIFADDAWFQENMGDFRDKYGLRCVLHGFSVPMKVEEKWAFVSRLVKAKAMQDEPSEIMKNIYALVKDKEYFVVTSNAEDHFVPAGFEADRVFEMEGKLTQMRCKNRCHDEVYPNQKAVLAMIEEEVNRRVPKELLPKCPKCGGDMEVNWGYQKICNEKYTIITDGIEELPFWENGVKYFMIKGPNEERIEFCQKL